MTRLDEQASTHFLNVDFDVACERDIAEVVEGLTPKAAVLHQTDALVSFELNHEHGDIETCLDAFVEAVEGLSASARGIWDGCARRTADVGLQAGTKPSAAVFPISHRTIAALAAIGCGVTLTVYAAPEPFDGASGEVSS